MTQANTIRLLLVDDHAIVREGLRTLLGEVPDLDLVGEAADGPSAVATAAALQPDVILLDLMLPGMNGIEVARRILARQPACRIIVLTSFADDQNVLDAIQAGAAGYLLKDVLQTDLVQAIRQAAQGHPVLHPEAQRKLVEHLARPQPAANSELDQLTERERDVLALIARGLSNRQIADSLHITEGTVKGHVSNVLSKLHLQDRTQAALFAVRRGLGQQA